MKLSPWAHEVSDYIPKAAFEKISLGVKPTRSDIESFVRLYIFENIPNFIIDKPIGFDRIREKIASGIDVDKKDIYLTGSAKLGFSLKPDNWLNPFNPEQSDIDFFVISESLYKRLEDDISIWKNDIRGKEYNAYEQTQKISKRGFLDTWHIPLRFKTSNKCNHAMYTACLDINSIAGRKIINIERGKNASVRCYKNMESALAQIAFNILDATQKVTLLV